MPFRAETQGGALAPVVWMNRIFCLDVFYFTGRPAYCLSFIYASVCAVLYALLYRSKGDVGWVAYQEISYTFVLWVNIVVSCVSVVLGFAHTKDSRRFIRRCELVDETLESFGVKREYTRFLRGLVFVIPTWVLSMVSLYAMDAYWMTGELGSSHGLMLCVLVHVPFCVNSMVVLAFCTFLRVLKDKLRKLNAAMLEVTLSAQPETADSRILVAASHVNRKRFVRHFLQTSRLVHLEIVRISAVLDNSYCYQMLLELVVEFTLLIGILYNTYFELMKLNTLAEVLTNRTVAAMSFWLLVNAGKIAAVNNLCTAVHDETKVTGQCLRELEGSYPDEGIRDEVQQFSLQLVLRPLCFSAGGYVYLNNRLTSVANQKSRPPNIYIICFQFFGTIMTYMAILVQMSSTPTAIRSLTQAVTD